MPQIHPSARRLLQSRLNTTSDNSSWTTPFTVEAQVKPSSKSKDSQLLFDSQNGGFGLSIEGGRFVFSLFDGEEYQAVRSNEDARPYETTHVAGVFDGRRIALFVDGNLQEAKDFEGGAGRVPGDLRRDGFCVGAAPPPYGKARYQKGFPGKMDEIRVSAAALYSDNFVPEARLANDSTTRVLYHFDAPDRGNARDSSGKSKHLKLFGATAFPEEIDKGHRDTLESLWRQGAKIQFVIERAETPVEAVTLEGSSFDPADASLLLEIPDLPAVNLIEFSDVSPILKTLSQSSSFRTLYLTRCDTSDGQLQHLPELRSLSELRLGACDLSTNGLATIAQAESVRVFGLSDCDLGEHGFRHLEAMNLSDLFVTDCPLGDDGMERIGRLERLSSLVLLRANVTRDGLPYISGCSNLRRVTLTDAPIDDTGLKYLGSLPELEHLYLVGTNVSDAGLVHLTDAENLDWLFVNRTFVTEEGVEALKKLRPSLNVSWNARQVRSRSEVQEAPPEQRAGTPAVVSTDGAFFSAGPLKLRRLQLGQRLEIVHQAGRRLFARLETAERGLLHGYVNLSDVSYFSQWYTAKWYQQEFDRRRRSGEFPVMVEGRESNGVMQYRAAFAKKTADIIAWHSGHGLPRSTFDARNRQRLEEGVPLLTSTSNRTANGKEWFHATWIKRAKQVEGRSSLPSVEEQGRAVFAKLDANSDRLLTISELSREGELHRLLSHRGTQIENPLSPAKFMKLLADAISSEAIDPADAASE